MEAGAPVLPVAFFDGSFWSEEAVVRRCCTSEELVARQGVDAQSVFLFQSRAYFPPLIVRGQNVAEEACKLFVVSRGPQCLSHSRPDELCNRNNVPTPISAPSVPPAPSVFDCSPERFCPNCQREVAFIWIVNLFPRVCAVCKRKLDNGTGVWICPTSACEGAACLQCMPPRWNA